MTDTLSVYSHVETERVGMKKKKTNIRSRQSAVLIFDIWINPTYSVTPTWPDGACSYVPIVFSWEYKTAFQPLAPINHSMCRYKTHQDELLHGIPVIYTACGVSSDKQDRNVH